MANRVKTLTRLLAEKLSCRLPVQELQAVCAAYAYPAPAASIYQSNACSALNLFEHGGIYGDSRAELSEHQGKGSTHQTPVQLLPPPHCHMFVQCRLPAQQTLSQELASALCSANSEPRTAKTAPLSS